MDGTTDGEGEENSKQVTTDVCHLRDVSESVHSGAVNLFFSFSFFLANFALFLFSIALSLSLIFSLPLIFFATLSLSLSSAT